MFEGPAIVNVSGGRSSGMMLRLLLDEAGGALPEDVIPVFANTGEEAEGTLIFVREISERWGVPIRWVEFQKESVSGALFEDISHWREVDYCGASRKGEPFDAMIDWKKYLPNPSQRICTEQLKVRAALGFAASLGFPVKRVDVGKNGRKDVRTFADFDQYLGIRADEPRRVAKNIGKDHVELPLHHRGISRGDVLAFWKAQTFDLDIRPGEGNCRLCFEKGISQLRNVARNSSDEGGLSRWVDREKRIGATMKKAHPYAKIEQHIRRQLPIFEPDFVLDDDLLPCACGD